MSDTPEKTETASLKFIIPVIVVVLLIAGAGIFITQTGVDKELVKGAVDGWGESLRASSKAKGMEVRFAYDEVVMEGGASNRHAILTNPRFIWEESAAISETDQKAVEMHLSAKTASIYPTSADLSSVRIEVPAPLALSADKTETVAISYENPLQIVAEASQKDGEDVFSSTVNFPSELTLTDTQSEEKLIVRSQEGGSLSTSFLQKDSRVGSVSVDVNKLEMALPEGKTVLTLDRFLINASNAMPDPNNTDMQVKVSIDSLMSDKEQMPYGPLSAALDAHYAGNVPEDGKPIDWMQHKLALTVNDFSIQSNIGGVAATADIKSADGDALPVGKIDLTIKNLKAIYDELRKNEVLAEQDEELIGAFLQRAVQGNIDQENIVLPIRRDAKGAFMIGKMSFEEVFAMILTSGGGSADPYKAGNSPHDVPPLGMDESTPEASPEAAPKE